MHDGSIPWRALLGRHVQYMDHDCIIVEYLEQDDLLILEPAAAGSEIQANQFGEPRRRAPLRFSIRVYAEDGRLHPALRALDPGAD